MDGRAPGHVQWERLVDAITQSVQRGLPLPGALEALAEQSPDRRTAKFFREVAARVSRGESLEDVLRGLSAKQSEELRAILGAAATTPQPAKTLAELLRLQRQYKESLRDLRSALAYPALCGAVATASYVMLPGHLKALWGIIWEIFVTEGELISEAARTAPREHFAQWFLWTFLAGLVAVGIGILSLTLLRVVAGPVWLARSKWIYRVPILGRFYKAAATGHFCALLRCLVEKGVTLPEALEAVANLIPWPRLRAAIQAAVPDVRSGQALPEVLKNYHWLPATLVTFLGEREGDIPLGERLKATGDLFLQQTRSNRASLETMLVCLMILGLYPWVQIILLLWSGLGVSVSHSFAVLSTEGDVWGLDQGGDLGYIIGALTAVLVGAAILLITRPRGRDFWRDTAPWVSAMRLVAWVLVGFGTLVLGGPGGILLLGLAFFFYPLEARQSFWLVLSSAIRNNLPLLRVLTAHLQDSRWVTPHPTVLRAIVAGQPLEEAVKNVRVTGRHRWAIHVGGLTGRWKEALETIDEHQLAVSDSEELFSWRIAWIVLASGMAAFVTFFSAHKIFPQYRAMLRDLGTTAPSFWQSVLEQASFVSGWVILAAIAISSLGAIIVYTLWFGGWPIALPFFSFGFQTKSLILEGLRHGIQGGKTYPEILDTLAKATSWPVPFFPRFTLAWGTARRIRRARAAILAGEEAPQALVRTRLISPADAEILASAEKLGNLAEAMGILAELYRERYAVSLRRWGIYGYLGFAAVIAAFVAFLYALTLNVLVAIAYAML